MQKAFCDKHFTGTYILNDYDNEGPLKLPYDLLGSPMMMQLKNFIDCLYGVKIHPPSTEKVAMFNQESNNHKENMIII